MPKKRTSEKTNLPAHTIIDCVHYRTRRTRQSKLHGEIVRLRDADPQKHSWAWIAKHLSAKHSKKITRDAVIKAYKRAKDPGPSPCSIDVIVVDHVLNTISFLPSSYSAAITFSVDPVTHTVSFIPAP
jgi:hypothetical protein